MIRILHVVPNMSAGGIETFLMNVYRCIDRNIIQFDFLVHYQKKCFYDDEIEMLGGHIYRLSVREDNNFLKYIFDLDNFFKIHKEYDIVHGHMASLAYFYMHSAKKNGIEHRIVHSHGDSHEYNLKGWIKYFAFKFARIEATDYFACSMASGRYLFGNRNFSIIHNPIDTEKFAYNFQIREQIRKQYHVGDKEIWGCIARFDQQKNHLFLLDIFSCYYANHSNTELWLIGAGPLEQILRKKTSDLNLQDAVNFLGLHHDVEKFYQGMDLFILPSNFEGLGIVAIEAQAAGLPVFVSENIPDEAFVTENIYALNLSEGDERWSEFIEKIMTDYQRIDMHHEVKKKGFDVKSETSELIKKYFSILYNNN